MKDAEISFLDNGLRLVHQLIPDSEVIHCGIFINAGSRDENSEQSGLAHFIEHLLFKGTKKRKAFHILNRLDAVGGEINAFTTKEETCIHVTCLKQHFERAVELMADILLNSTFPEEEAEREKEIIIDEINSCRDTPSEQIYDDFEEYLFSSHPLSYPILGTVETVRKLKIEDAKQFIKKYYTLNNMCFSSVGSIPIQTIKKVCNKYLGDIPSSSKTYARTVFNPNKPFDKRLKKQINQAHLILGGLGYNYNDYRRWGLILLNNILGGPGMNSRLNLTLREKHGIAYNIFSSYIPYSDTGCFSIYIATDFSNTEKAIQLVLKELKSLREKGLSDNQLKQAKNQLLGQIAISQENRSSLMQFNGKNLLNYNLVESYKDTFDKILKLKASDIKIITEEILVEEQFSLLVYKKE